MQKKSTNLEIPLLCAIATTASLEKYADYIPVDLSNVIPVYKEWNRALIHVLKKEPYYNNLNDLGKIILNNTKAQKLGSPELAVKFTQAYNFCSEKIKKLHWKDNIEFMDIGCGFSPLSIILKSEFNNLDLYILDYHEISNIFMEVAQTMGIQIQKRPVLATTKQKLKSRSHFDITSSMACFPYISTAGQIKRLNLIQKVSSHFIIELYNNLLPIPGQKSIGRFTNNTKEIRAGLGIEDLNKAIRSKGSTKVDSLQSVFKEWYGENPPQLPKKMKDLILTDNSIFLYR